VRVVRQNELQMVVDVRLALADHSQPISVLKLQLHRVGIDDSCRHWKIVHQQVNKVLVFDSLRDLLGMLRVPVHRRRLRVAQELAVDILCHSHLIRRVHDSVA
jgi:hypothetical protein